MGVQDEKRVIRRRMQTMRLDMPAEEVREKSHRIAETVLSLPAFAEADTVCLYLPIHHEVETAEILQACRRIGKKMAAPRICDGEMEFIRFSSYEELVPGAYGILEPDGEKVVSPEADGNILLLMPGVAFDRSLRRIGHGGGYYDRYLARHAGGLHTAALAYAWQVLESVPAEPFDVRPQIIVTETCIIHHGGLL